MPDFKDDVRLRVARLHLEPTREAAIIEEMAQHLEQRFEELIAQGISATTARETVLRDLNHGKWESDLLKIEKQVRLEPAITSSPGIRGTMACMAKDLRYTFRSLRLNPGFTSIAILSLALGIGANTAIFQLLDAVRLRTLPVKNPGELVDIRVPNAGRRGEARGNYAIFTTAIWEQIRDHQQAFSGMAAWGTIDLNLSSGGRARGAHSLFVNGDFFNTLDVPPVLGRVFSVSDDFHGCGLPGAVISYAFWQREFGGKASAVGSKLTVEGHPVEVLGVTGPGFYGVEVGGSYDLALPICSEPVIAGEDSVMARSDGWWLAVIARLKPGWTRAKATAQLESISSGIFQATLPAGYQTDLAQKFLAWKLAALPAGTGLSRLRSKYEEPLWILLAIAGTVLLIACANLANLMFARANAREREIAVRLALGASRIRLMQQLLMESLLLSAIGAAAGILLAQALTRGLISFFSTQFGRITLDLGLDWRVLGFTAAVAILTCVLFGLMPAVKSTSTSPIVAMKAGSRGVSAGRERFGLGRALVVIQVAMSMVLLVSAFLFVRSFQNLVNQNAGFRQAGILAAGFDFSQLNLPVAERNNFKQQFVDRLRALPGVEAAAAVDVVPFSGNRWNEDVHYDDSGKDVHQVVDFNRVSPGFFHALEIPLVRGSDFGPDNTLNSPAVAVVNESFVRTVLKQTEPLGKIFRVDEGAGVPESVYQIIGVVKDTKYLDMREDFGSIAYLPTMQDKKPKTSISVLLHSDLAMDSLTTSVERAIAEINPAIAIQFSIFKTQIRDTMVRERLMASLSGFFGILAAILATVGLYGVISYMVTRRRNEIGIRMALGADRRRVLALIMKEAGVLLLIGLAIGTALSLASTRAAATLLYGLKPHDPVTLALAGLSLAAVAIIASYLPALRATRIHPTEALREE